MNESFLVWFERFLAEKRLPEAHWTIVDSTGVDHFIGSDVVIVSIKRAPEHEQLAIKEMIVRIDFANGDVNDFFHYLAKGLVAKFDADQERENAT